MPENSSSLNTAQSNKMRRDYEATRKSLIARLTDWEDQRTWDEFYKTYWKLIYAVSLEAGLRTDEAFDVVQETILGIAKQSKKNLYDPKLGSFKAWLLNMTRWRITDQFRKRKKDSAANQLHYGEDDYYNATDQFADPKKDLLERLWDSEWKKNLTQTALERIKPHVSPKHFQIFHCYVIQGWSAKKVQEHLDITIGQVYLAKHRVSALFKKEIEQLERDEEKNP